MFVDRELILPARTEVFYPSWLNHMHHTVVLPLLLAELTLVYHIYPTRSLGGTITATLALAYLAWVNLVFYVGGFWVYPVFGVLSLPWRVLFMFVCSCLGLGIYLVGE